MFDLDNFTAGISCTFESINNDGVLQPIWAYLRFNYGHIMRSPLFPPFFALSIDYLWVLVFTSKSERPLPASKVLSSHRFALLQRPLLRTGKDPKEHTGYLACN